MSDADVRLFAHIWSSLPGAGPAPPVEFSGPLRLLPSVYDVSALAAATVAAATASVAALWARRTGQPVRTAHVDRTHASVAFRSERYVETVGWPLPAVWDPLAGDYPTADGWIRLHTNYAYHRDAVLRVLGVPASRDAAGGAARAWMADDLEAAVVAEGGCAARMRTAAEWARHPQGAAVAAEPLFDVRSFPTGSLDLPPPLTAPLDGIRVLDLTRVMAGPVCSRLLAAYGADVLRVDPPGFEEVGALLPEMTVGKRRAFLDLKRDVDRRTFEELLASSHVLVHGYRSDALERLDLGAERRRQINACLVDVSHDAYGFTGPWSGRRGFDSLVQMSVGIADRGREARGADGPCPLPAQALDHGCGYLLATAACHGLARLVDRQASTSRLSLARVAKLLTDLVGGGDIRGRDLADADVDRCREQAETAFGPVRRVRCPGRIDGFEPRWTRLAGPLGADAAAWT
jgi:crotonobetainyl-CoA:carnitine CoA-transferase CaiB-like acyl-CoA transferase